MEKKTEGAWIIHQTKKIGEAQDFEDIEFAGKCGVFLSNLAASDEQSEITPEKVDAIRKVSKIKKAEIGTIANKLQELKLIDTSKDGSIAVLGITTSTVLGHTSDVFNLSNPNNFQKAALNLSESISNLPMEGKELATFISDTHKLTKEQTNDLFQQSEEIGLVDYEKLDDSSKLYFNGNLFKHEVVKKTSMVFGSMKPEETKKIVELDSLLTDKGCIDLDVAKRILGDALLNKLQSIGMYDLNDVSNSKETKTFITKPAAFSKFGNPFAEDALDLAKAFVSALYYGINFSSSGRGKITMLGALMRKLVNGQTVGPAEAIGEDYKILELNRVIEVRKERGGTRYFMRLLKRDIGELALQVLKFGDASEMTIQSSIYSGSVTGYTGPEEKRYAVRSKQQGPSKTAVAELLRTFRS